MRTVLVLLVVLVMVVAIALAGSPPPSSAAKTLEGKPLCTATRTADCVNAVGPEGSFAVAAPIPTGAPAGSAVLRGNIYASPAIPFAARNAPPNSLALAGAVYATGVDESSYTYYVDCVDGDDNRTGNTPAKAWKTIAKVNGATLSGGQSVAFRRGCTWREQLTVPAAGASLGVQLAFGAYGAGTKPLFVGSDLISGPWTVYAGAVYVADFAGLWDAAAAWQDTTGILLKAANKESLTSAGMFYPDVANGKFYVRMSDDSDPTGHIVEANRRTAGVSSDKRWVTVRDLAVRHAQNGIQFLAGAPISQGSFVQRNTITDCYGQGIYVAVWTLTIEDNEIRRCWNGKAYGASGAGGGIRFDTNTAVTPIARRNLIADCYLGISMALVDGPEIYRNVVLRSKVNGIDAHSTNGAYPALVYHNIVVHHPAGTDGHGIAVQDPNGGYVSFRNNVVVATFAGTPSNVQCVAVASTAFSGIDLDNNLYYVVPGGTAYVGKVGSANYSTLAAYQAALAATAYTGKDTHALNIDPLIADLVTLPIIRTDSPALNVGSPLIGYNDKYLGSGPDLGWIEVH